MTATRIVKRLVCSECGQPLADMPVPAAAVDRVLPLSEEDEDEGIVPSEPEMPVEIVDEVGPVCPRCAGYR